MNLMTSNINGQVAMVYYETTGHLFRIDEVTIDQKQHKLEYDDLVRIKKEIEVDYVRTKPIYDAMRQRHGI
jgi:hypothetical protein